MATKTLAEDDASLSSEPPKSQTLMPGSRSEHQDSTVGAQENGVRVCATDNDRLVLVSNQVAETEILGVTNFGNPNNRGVWGGFAEVGGGLSSSENGKQDGAVDHGGGNETVKDLDSVFGVENNGENGGEKIGSGVNSTVLIEDGSSRKEGLFDENGISLVVEVHGCLDVSEEKKDGHEVQKVSLAEYGGKKEMGKNGTAEENGEDIEAVGEDNRDVDGPEYEYSVGDFVWGKIRSHPWWPGQVYDVSDASEQAITMYKERDRFLVAYFGDGSFSWCSPSQLQHFVENFEEKSKQSSAKSFVNAVQNALGEIGRLVELQMTCLCIPEDNRIGLARPLAMNAGIKEGVLVPEGGIRELAITQQESTEILATLREIARVVSISSMLELTVLKSWLSAFCRAKGGYQLAMFREPQQIEGLEDKKRSGLVDITDVIDQVEVPIEGSYEEDWLSSPVAVGVGFDTTTRSQLQKCPVISPDKLYQRRKQKSVAELMGEDMDVEPPQSPNGGTVEVTLSGKLASTSGKKKMKSIDKADSQGASDLVSPSTRKRGRRKKDEILGSPSSAENKAMSVDNGYKEGKVETNKGTASREGKKKKNNSFSSIEDDVSKANEGNRKVSTSRERKKSKYLSPPFTSPKWKGKDSSPKYMETDFVKVAKVARMGERMTRAAGLLIGSPPIVKCSGETFKKKHSKQHDTGDKASAISSLQTPKEDQKIIDPVKIHASANEVLNEVRLAALNPLYLRENKTLDTVRGFVSVFRSSIYLTGSNYKMYHKRKPGRKRKSLNSDPVSLGKDLYQTDLESPEYKLRAKKEKSGHAKSNMPKLQSSASGNASSPVALIVTFPPEFSLPTKHDLITIFSKFGAINEVETDVLFNSYSARVVFLRSSDAEQAFSVSVGNSPFSASNVNYQLQYSSSASKTRKVNGKVSASPKEGSKTLKNLSSSNSSVDELLFIRQKLEMMTSMLEKSEMSPEMKSDLEAEMKGLLEKSVHLRVLRRPALCYCRVDFLLQFCGISVFNF
ncbi:PWWP domain-containing protein 3 [Cornus florida]|uniref:PWWP domain-containing protein 3 n=1 Tax=Cornus florida TaxID=4283 RepID=UPI00289D15C4|nr:PWWP domain-containing protein 3 [Cornus florida]